MDANNFRKPVYGDPDVALRDFRQKHKPHLAFAELVGDDQKTMEYCPIYGQPWGVQSEPLPEETLQNYRRRKERERERKVAEANGAVSKKKRKSRKRPRPLSGGDPPIVQPDAPAVYASPATALPAPEPPTTQWAMHSDGRTPSTSPPHAVAQGYSADPNWVPLMMLAQHPPPGPTSFVPDFSSHPVPAPMVAPEEYGVRVRYSNISLAPGAMAFSPGSGRETVSGTPPSDPSYATMVHPPTGVSYGLEGLTTEYTTPDGSQAPPTYLHQVTVANQACVTSPSSRLPGHHYLPAPACTIPNPHYPTPGPVDDFKQDDTAGVTYSRVPVAPQGSYAASYMARGPAPEAMYAADDAYTARPPVTWYSEMDGGSPSQSPPSTWVKSPGFYATPSSPHIATQLSPGMTAMGDSMRGIDYNLNAAYQGFTRAEYRSPVGSPSLSIAMPAPGPVPVEYILGTAQQTNGGGVPQTYSTAMIDNTVGAIGWHRAEEQGPHDVPEVTQTVYLPQDEDWSAPSAVALRIDGERSDYFERAVNNTYAYNQDARVQYTPVAPQTTDNVDAYPLKQSSYSELSHALQYSAHGLMDECAPSNLATSPWSMVTPAPEANIDFYTHSSSSGFGAGCVPLPLAPPYAVAQGVIFNETQSGMSTHLWSPSAYAPPQYPYNDHLYTSAISSSMMMVETNSPTHIDSQCSAIRYDHSATA